MWDFFELLRVNIFLIIAAASLVFITVVVVFSAKKSSKAEKPAHILVFSSCLCCLLMLPLCFSLGQILKSEIRTSVEENRWELSALEDRIRLLENSQISVQSFREIAEVALLETEINRTRVEKRQLSHTEAGLGIRANSYYDEALIAIVYDLTVKYGVDMASIHIKKDVANPQKVYVSGIKSKFIGIYQDEKYTPVSEIRRVNLDEHGEIRSIHVQNSGAAVRRATQIAEDCDNDFKAKLSDGSAPGFMDEAVIKLAQNFIKVILAPIFTEIEFTKNINGGVPIQEFFQRELDVAKENKEELLSSSILLEKVMN